MIKIDSILKTIYGVLALVMQFDILASKKDLDTKA